jgi:hypothetical protein
MMLPNFDWPLIASQAPVIGQSVEKLAHAFHEYANTGDRLNRSIAHANWIREVYRDLRFASSDTRSVLEIINASDA